MTTETLKPFIAAARCTDNATPVRSSATTRGQRKCNLTTFVLCAVAMILTLALLGFTVWNCLRTSRLESEVKHLDKVIVSMQKRLGLTDLDDMSDLDKEYNHMFIEDPNTLDDVHDDDMNLNEDLIDDEDDADMDDEDDEKEFDYEEFRRKYTTMNYDEDEDDVAENENTNENEDVDDEDEDMDISDNDNLFDDFYKFNVTRKKQTRQRKSRSIMPLEHSTEAQRALETIRNIDSNVDKLAESHKQQQTKMKMLMLRLPSQRLTEDTGSKIEPRSALKDKMERRRSIRRHTEHRRNKNINLKSGESHLISAKSMRRLQSVTNTPAAHFHLNRKIPNRYASINIDSYAGDMYIGHPSWSNEIDVDNYFKVENGVLTVHETGLYYVYAQVCYNNTHDQNGFVIFHGHKPFLQCLNTVPTNMPHKIHTCHTSGLVYLKENETIHLRDFHSDRNVILKDGNNRSYFGLIKI